MRRSGYQKLFKATLATTVATGALVAVAPINTKAETRTFSDVKNIPSHHFYEAVMNLSSRGVFGGYPDGTFKPGQSINRQHAAKFLALTLGLDTVNVKDPGFKDVSKKSAYYGYIAALVEAGIISGYVDNTFKPEANLTRKQMAKMLVLGFGIKAEGSQRNPFSDISDKQWHKSFVQTLYSNEITTGTTPTTFSPNALVTRGQMASFIFRSEAATKKPEPEPKPEPVDKDLLAVQAAYNQLKTGKLTISRGDNATDEVKLTAVQAYVTSLVTEKGVVAKATAGKTAGNYVVTLTKGKAKVERTIAVTFDIATNERIVTEVKAINAKQVEVKFATPVTKTTVVDTSNIVRNMTLTTVTSATTNAGQLTGSLSADGKTLTITASGVFNGEYTFKSTDAIKSVTGEKFEEYTMNVKAYDTIAPKLVSGSATAKTTTHSFSLFFDEPVNATGASAYVNNAVATVTTNPTNPNRLDVTARTAISVGTTVSIKLTNVKDYNNNSTSPNPVETFVTIATDTVAPTVTNVLVTGGNKIELTYDKDMNIASFKDKARIVHSNGTVTNLTASTGKNAKTVVLSGMVLSYNDKYNATLFVDADVKDTGGNSSALYSTNVIFNQDMIAPALKTVEWKDGKIVASFTEDIAIGNNNVITAVDQYTGIATSIYLNYYNSQNAVIVNNTLTIAHPLPNGTYQLRLPVNTVVDKSNIPNPNALAALTFSVQNSDTTGPEVFAVTNKPVADGVAPGAWQMATYTVTDVDSGVNLLTVQDINNYSWDGRALPAGSYTSRAVTNGSADRATSVAVTVYVPSASIRTTKTASFIVNNIRDNAENTIAYPGMGDVRFVSGNQTQPEFNHAAIKNDGSLELSFSEAIQSLETNDFEVTLNNQPLKASSIARIDSSNSTTFVTGINASLKKDVEINGGIRDVIYLDTSGNYGYDAGDLILQVLDQGIYRNDVMDSIPINLNASYITSLRVKLIRDNGSPVQNYQGIEAVFNKEIIVK
ncbi:S-layer-like y domain-containing protein [Sporosarcina sp. ANT_H38]|uniref:S-layer homology domain-containing protein n=1 Tax=Sporosarcina sp. ANT_H38 TaxID=2597358 RepID=UPI00165E621F|nr:S-layer homology domain-containing protein [Sporosarcina sp. ANT_H38]